MKWSDKFILVTSASYLGCVFMTLFGFPPMKGMDVSSQIVYYVLGMFGCLLSLRFDKVGYAMSVVYGFVAIWSFSGVQVWVNYDNSLPLGPFMALWDLVLGIAFLDGFELPSMSN